MNKRTPPWNYLRCRTWVSNLASLPKSRKNRSIPEDSRSSWASPGRPLTKNDALPLLRRTVADGLAEPFLLDADAGLAFAGDACLPKGTPGGIEAAWTSGTALGAAL